VQQEMCWHPQRWIQWKRMLKMEALIQFACHRQQQYATDDILSFLHYIQHLFGCPIPHHADVL
jgi:hypothetical protein